MPPNSPTETLPLLPHSHVSPHLKTPAVMALIINKMIGTGIFSTPALIFTLSGNIGTSLLLWLMGGIITFCGLSVYLDFGLNIPLNGGEKNYLQRVWQRPKHLIESVYTFQIVLLGFSSGNSYALGRYVLFAMGFKDVSDWYARWIGVGVITFSIYLHLYHRNASTRLFTILGFSKILILVIIIALGGLTYIEVIKVEHNENFHNIWENYQGYEGNSYNIAVALLQIVYSFKGWENANYVLSEIHDPHRTLKIAAPLSVLITTVLFFLVVLSYCLVIPKEEFKESGVLIAGIFFNKIFGESISSRILPMLISLSNFGNVLAVSFSHSRINQELARENLIPFANLFSKLPYAMLLHWFVTAFVLLAPPKGDIYELVVNLYSYPGTWVNIFVTLGLFYLHKNAKREQWGKYNTLNDSEHRWDSYWLFSLVFLVSNVFLALFPFVKPPQSYLDLQGDSYPYYVFPVTGCSVLFAGVIYWLFRHRI